MAQVDTGLIENTNATTIESGDGITAPEQYFINNITLLLEDCTAYELKKTLVELSVYEDLFSPATSGYVMVTDAQGFIEKFNFSGFSFIEISYSKGRGDPNPFKRTFRVYKIGERKQVSRSNEMYTINFCSEELFLSEQIRIAKSFPNFQISDIIKSILTEDLQVEDYKIGIIEETKGLYNFIVPNLKPFEAFNWLSTYAQPADTSYHGADMLFFENRDGYNFRSLQSMMGDDYYRSYNYSPQNTEKSDINFDFGAILSYRIMETFDSLKTLNSGGYANKILTLDPLLRKANVSNFSYDEYFKDSESLNKYGVSSEYVNRLGKNVSRSYESVYKMCIGNSQQRFFGPILETTGGVESVAPNIDIETFVPHRTAQLTLINHTRVQMLVPGDPSLKVGSVVELNLPSYGDEEYKNAAKLDKKYSGYYLITAVSHKMDIRGVYQCLVEVVQDSNSLPNRTYISNQQTQSLSAY